MKRSIMLFLVMLAALSASADTLIVTDAGQEYPGDGSIFGEPAEIILELPQFDPALGTLQSVELTIDTGHNGTFTFTAIESDWNVRIDYLDWYYEVNAFGGEDGNLVFLPYVTPPDDEEPFGQPPGHFNLPLTPVLEGETFGPLPFGNSQSNTFTYGPGDAEFASFIGDATVPIQMLDAMVFGVTFFGQGESSWQLETVFDITATAVYTYESSVATEVASWSSVKSLFD